MLPIIKDRATLQKVLFVTLLILLHLVPIWIFRYFPSQDGASHLHNAHVLKEYSNPEYTRFREIYKLNIAIFPNWMSYPILIGLMYIFPPLIAEKILISLCICLLPLSMLYFLNAVNKGKTLFWVIGLLYSYTFVLHMGFYNFSLSMPLYFFALGYWWKNRDSLNIKNIAVLNALLIMTYLCHFFTYQLSLFSLFLLSITSYRRPKKIFTFLCSMLPMYFISASYVLSQPRKLGGGMKFAERLKYFLSTKSLVYYGDGHLIITYALLGIIVLLFILTIWKDKIKARRFLEEKDQFLLLSIVIIVLHFIAPASVGPGGYIKDRLNLFPFLVMLAWFSKDYHRYAKYAFTTAIILLSVAHITYSGYYYHKLNKDLKEFASAVDLVEKNSVTLTIYSDWEAGVKYVAPMANAANLYCIGNGCVNLGDYEALYNYFPVNWREKYSGIVDYVVVWKQRPEGMWFNTSTRTYHKIDVNSFLKNLEKDYDLVKSTENLKLFRYHKE